MCGQAHLLVFAFTQFLWLAASETSGIYGSETWFKVLGRRQSPANGELNYGKPTFDIAAQLVRGLSTNITDACANQTLYMASQRGSTWAFQMLDSVGKPASGIMEGNFNWLGDFDECTNLNTGENLPIFFSGQYCRLSVPITLSGQSIALQVGICVPSGCSSNDTTAFVNAALMVLDHANYPNVSVDCHPVERPLDSKAQVAIIVLSILAGLVLIGTCYDVVMLLRSSARDWRRVLLVQHNSQASDQGSSTDRVDPELAPLLGSRADPGSSMDGRGLLGRLFLSFSCYSNGLKLLSTSQTQGSLGCLNGIRFLSICWVVLGHAYFFSASILSDGALFLSQTITSKSFQVVFNASVSVDSFFLLSGLLATYIILKEIEKRNGSLSAKEWILVYLHRYIRLTPAYAVVLMVWTCLAIYLADGPLWPTSSSFDSCPLNWWSNLLYVNNLVRPKLGTAACMDWTWYLANDMQFFVITPLLALLLYRFKYAGIAVVSSLIAGSIAATTAISAVNSYKIGFLGGIDGSWFEDLYITPWCRFEPYGFGILLGYILHKHAGKCKMHPVLAIFGWLVAAACCLAVVYGPYEAEFGSKAMSATVAEAAAYNSLSKVAWSVGMAWVIFACSTGYGGWVNTVLSWRAFVPLGRLTYCLYLIHPIVMYVAAAASRNLIHFDVLTMVPRFLGMLAISAALAFAASLISEAPILAIEKAIRERGKAA